MTGAAPAPADLLRARAAANAALDRTAEALRRVLALTDQTLAHLDPDPDGDPRHDR